MKLGRLASLSEATDRLLSDCTVEFGNSIGWASALKPPVYGTYDNAANITVRGLFERFYRESVDREGDEIGVSIEALRATNGTDVIIQHNDRVLITLDDDSDAVKFVFRVRNIRNDGKYRTLLYLHVLGPVCLEEEEEEGITYEFPIFYGSYQFNECVSLNEVLPHRA